MLLKSPEEPDFDGAGGGAPDRTEDGACRLTARWLGN
jgi:hypothetical protein